MKLIKNIVTLNLRLRLPVWQRASTFGRFNIDSIDIDVNIDIDIDVDDEKYVLQP